MIESSNPSDFSSPLRIVRVFVSSTFKDMHEEREELVKRVFPALRKRCERRGVVFGDVDLRWGVTDEERAEGQVLPVCLAQIRRSSIFIGLLGERYGWVPDQIPLELLVSEAWLGDHQDRSVTELEILAAALVGPVRCRHAFFYFRDAAYSEALLAGSRDSGSERPDSDSGPPLEEVRYGSAEDARKLAELKQHIRRASREHGFTVREGYASPERLRDLVQRDLEAIVDREFPEGTQPDSLSSEASVHAAFYANRRRVFVGRPGLLSKLDDHVSGDGQPLAIVGEPGIGKSALLANWVGGYLRRHPEVPVLVHVVGVTGPSRDWRVMLRQLMEGINRRHGLHLEIPDGGDQLNASFKSALDRVAERGRTVIIIDGVEKLEPLALWWIPARVPPNVRLLLSLANGPAMEAIEVRNWPYLDVGSLSLSERLDLIHGYLAFHSKTLQKEQSERIARAGQAGNPLFLRYLLDELRLHGRHETLTDRIDHYLGAETLTDLVQRVLARYEGDYEGERPGLVRDAMAMLWASGRGLSESELLDLLGEEEGPLPQQVWAPLFLAAEEMLHDRNGLLGVLDEPVRRALEESYLITEPSRQDVHARLAAYFARDPLSERSAMELPYQLAAAGKWGELADRFSDFRFLSLAWRWDRFEVLRRWREIEEHSDRRLGETYQRIKLSAASQDQLALVLILCLALGGDDARRLIDVIEARAFNLRGWKKLLFFLLRMLLGADRFRLVLSLMGLLARQSQPEGEGKQG